MVAHGKILLLIDGNFKAHCWEFCGSLNGILWLIVGDFLAHYNIGDYVAQIFCYSMMGILRLIVGNFVARCMGF